MIGTGVITPCTPADHSAVLSVINQAAVAYEGAVPPDRWKVPYMSPVEFGTELAKRVRFYAYREGDQLLGVMGIQDIQDVTLIRHAYVLPEHQRRGLGRGLLEFLLKLTARPMLVGTWRAAGWAIQFYERNGFTRVPEREARELLRRYWTVPERQVQESVVLADVRWTSQHPFDGTA